MYGFISILIYLSIYRKIAIFLYVLREIPEPTKATVFIFLRFKSRLEEWDISITWSNIYHKTMAIKKLAFFDTMYNLKVKSYNWIIFFLQEECSHKSITQNVFERQFTIFINF